MEASGSRGRRRRVMVVGAALVALVAVIAVVIALVSGGGGDGERTVDLGTLSVAAEMTSDDYEALRNGEEETVIVERLGTGLREEDADQGLLPLFPSQPDDSHCTFWNLSDAPGHLARLCFEDGRDVLLQKSVAARGEGGPPKTLA